MKGISVGAVLWLGWMVNLAFCYTTEEKQTFIRDIYNKDTSPISDLFISQTVTPRRFPWEKEWISYWEVYVSEFDINEDGIPDLLVGDYAGRDGGFGLYLYTFRSNTWQRIRTNVYLGTILNQKCLVETTSFGFRPCEIPSLTPWRAGSDYDSFDELFFSSMYSDVPGVPLTPSISRNQWIEWLSVLRKMHISFSTPPTSTPSEIPGPPETCPSYGAYSTISPIENHGTYTNLNYKYRKFRKKANYSVLLVQPDGSLTNQEFPGGIRDMIADPGFRSWVRTMPMDIFQGSNAVPVQIAEPRLAEHGSYRIAFHTNTLSQAKREQLAETLAAHGFSTNSVYMISADLNGDGTEDALITTNEFSTLTNDNAEWRTWLHEQNQWVTPEESVRQVNLDDTIRFLRSHSKDFITYNKTKEMIGMTTCAPPIPPVFLAGTNDIYRIWTSPTQSCINVFSVTGPHPWDVSSPLVDVSMPEDFQKLRFLNGYRREFGERVNIYQLFHLNDGTVLQRDFFDLFPEDSSSGFLYLEGRYEQIPFIAPKQIDRLLPEPLLPDAAQPSRP